jgi:Fur family ferric uptake transcriptional regulator
MTAPTETRRLAVANVAAALTTLRSRGLRASAARRVLLEALFAAEGPVSAETIAGGLGGRFPASDLASVYRNLGTLEAIGLVRHVHVARGPALYALNRREVHGYAACGRCGAHHPLPAAIARRVADVVRDACGYETSLVRFPIVGRCPGCWE